MYKSLALIICCSLFACASYAALHDPTLPAGIEDVGADVHSTIKIQSIIDTPSKKVVMVAGQEYKVGDEINGAKIVAISFDTVTLKGQHGTFKLSLFHALNKQPSVNTGEAS